MSDGNCHHRKIKINCQLFSLFEKKKFYFIVNERRIPIPCSLFFWKMQNDRQLDRAEHKETGGGTNQFHQHESWALNQFITMLSSRSSFLLSSVTYRSKNLKKSRCFVPSRRYFIIKEWWLIKFKRPGFCCPFSSALSEGRCLKFLNNKIANHLC